MSIRKLITLYIFFLLSFYSYAEDLFYESNKMVFEVINSNHGLSNDEVRKVYQTRNGFIWFCTKDGLIRYDAYNFKTYKPNSNKSQTFTSKDITSICEDQNGNLWLGTFNSGVNVFNPITEEVTTIQTGGASKLQIINNNIRSVFCDKNGDIWIGTVGGLCRYSSKDDDITNFQSLDINDVIFPLNNIHSITSDSLENIWFSAWIGYVFHYNMKTHKFSAYQVQVDDGNFPIRSLYIDSQNTMWIGTWENGLYRVDSINDGKLFCKVFKYNRANLNSISGNIVFSINEDMYRNLWVGTPYGLNIITNPRSDSPQIIRKHSNPESKNNPSNTVIQDIYCDNDKIMWLGTLGDGVNKVDFLANKFESYKIPEFNPQRKSQTIHAIIENKQGDLLIGVRSLGLVKYSRYEKNFLYYKNDPLFKNLLNYNEDFNTAFCYLYDHSGFLWIGTRYNGAFRINESTNEIKHFRFFNNKKINIRTVNSILEDSKNRIWIGTGSGLCLVKFDENNSDNFNITQFTNTLQNPNSISGNSIQTLYEDKEGTIWIGTSDRGLNYISKETKNPKQFEFTNFQTDYKNPQSISSNDINSIFQDTDANIWIGTSGGGLNLLMDDKKNFKTYGEVNDPIGDAIFDIAQDERGELWLSTNAGLVHFSPNKPKGEQFETYTVEDGLKSNILNKGAFYLTSDGHLFFGGYKGLNSFKPSEVPVNPNKPSTLVTEINVFNKPYKLLPKNGEQLVLNYKQYNFSIEFTALAFSQPSKNLYAYKLEGFDDEWQYTSSKDRKAYYANLRAGNYVFKLKAANSSGIWSNQEYVLHLKIKPAPYYSWWAYSIYGIVFLFILIVIYRFLLSRQRIQKDLEIEHIERVKSEKLNSFKLRFFTNISHELLTPLSILSAIVEGLQEGKKTSANSILILQRNIERLIKLIHQLLIFRKIETENLQLKVSDNDIAAFLKTLACNFNPLVANKNINFQVTINPEKIHGFFDDDKIDKITHNLLSNAFKYTPEGGKVELTCAEIDKNGNRFIHVEISDSGRGIPHEKLGYIFDRFTRLERESISGSGIGLELTKKLVELHNGEIGVESILNEGTKFFYTIPVHREAYLEEQISDSSIDYSSYNHPEIMKLLAEQNETEVNLETEQNVETDKKKVLIIEDNSDFRTVLQNNLSDDYQVFQAGNGEEGLTLAKKVVPEVIISDVMMPVMDGIKFCAELKNTLEISHIPVILLTAKVNVESKTQGYDVGADSYIEKPVNFNLLKTRIKSLIDQREKFRQLFKSELNLEPSKINVPSLDEKYFIRVKDIIEKNIDNAEFSVNMLVDEMATSNSMLYRKISSLTGMSPNEFIKSIRLKRAEQLLKEKKHSISEIAYITGFNNQSYFGVCFKKQFGMSPSEFLERLD